MIKMRIIGRTIHTISDNPAELFPDEPYKVAALKCALEIMNDCLDYIYDLMHSAYPHIFRPKIYLSSSEEINAVSSQKDIVVYTGLILTVISLINQKYTDAVLDKYDILKTLTRDEIRAGLRVYTWRFAVLHELFHIWHTHLLWINKYQFSVDGKVESKLRERESKTSPMVALEEKVTSGSSMLSEEDRQLLLTFQAIELDADSCALSMIINMLMRDTKVRLECGRIVNEEEYITAEVGLIMGAMATTFSLFDGNAGAKFELLKFDLDNMDHPIPAIRMYVAEEVADEMLWKYYPEKEKHFEIEKAWQRIVCDIEPYHQGKVDMGHVFYYTAYTEKAQRHLEKLRYRFNDMRETLEKMTLCALAEKMEDRDIEFDSRMVWFTDDGVSTRGWVNPATGKQYLGSGSAPS